MKNKKNRMTAGTICLAVAMIQSSSAALLYGEGGSFTDTANQGLVGFNFTVSETVNVTELGFFGLSMGGEDTPWAALYNVTTSTLLADVSWAAGTAGAGWNYQTLDTAVTLSTGTTYQVVGTAYWSPTYTDTASFTYGAGINPIGFTTPGGFGAWGSSTMATAALDSTPNVVANAVFEAIPEPSSSLLLLGGLGGVLLLRRRDQR